MPKKKFHQLDDFNWVDEKGNITEAKVYSAIPQDLEKLYVYWNELTKLVKFYFENKDNQDVSLNDIYFEIIGSIEDTLDKNKCGSLKEQYKRPFQKIIGCEFEMEKRNQTTKKALAYLYEFLGGITELSPPTKEGIIKIKRDNPELFKKIDHYIKNHLSKQPTPKTTLTEIKITEMPKIKIEGLADGLEKIAHIKKQEVKNKFPYKLSAGTKWENIIIKFLDDENVFIQVKQFKQNADYKEMGLVGKGNNPNPSEAWTFLKVLARLNGELTLKDPEAKDKYKKQKEFLAKSLQSYFSLDYDPFYPYHSSSEKSGNSYKIKITLIPPPTDNKKPDIKEDEDGLGLKEYLDEQAPQVYENE